MPGHILARTPPQLIRKLAKNLGDSDVQYALTGAGAASMLAPFVTAVPVVDVWVSASATPEELFQAAGAEAVQDGQNIVFLQAKGDSSLVFAEKLKGVRVANRFRVYTDLLGDPRRGSEQAKHLRSEVIGF
jgi:phosphoribosylcarboxyaminoimidazole (NCAIR) mutase